jgi:hypothetical protein
MNDLLQKLFKWKKHIQYEDVDFYLRIVGDQVVEDARHYALLESRKMRRDLRNPESDAFLIHLDPMKDLDDDDLKAAIVIIAASDIMRDYTAATPKPITPPLGNNPSLEEQEQHELEKEEAEKEYIENVQAYVEEWRVKFMAQLDRVTRENLEKQYAKYRTDRVCLDVFNRTFEDHLVAGSIYSDENYKERSFTFDEFRSLPNDVREVFRDAYVSMSIDPDTIKN